MKIFGNVLMILFLWFSGMGLGYTFADRHHRYEEPIVKEIVPIEKPDNTAYCMFAHLTSVPDSVVTESMQLIKNCIGKDSTYIVNTLKRPDYFASSYVGGGDYKHTIFVYNNGMHYLYLVNGVATKFKTNYPK